MNCADFWERHLEILEGNVPPLAEASLRAHARRCAECGRLLEEAEEFRGLVGEAVRGGPSLDWNFTRRVIDSLPPRSAPARSRWRRLYDRAMLPVAAAALVALCVALALAPAAPLAVLEYAADYSLVREEGRAPFLGAVFDSLRDGDVVETPPFDVAGLTLRSGRVALGPRSRLRIGRDGLVALLDGEATVRTASASRGIVVEAAGTALEVNAGSFVRIVVSQWPEPRWIADVAFGTLRAGDTTFEAKTKARSLGALGLASVPLTPDESAAVTALADRRPERQSSADGTPREHRSSAIDTLLLRSSTGADVARDATLANLGDAAAVGRLVEAAARSGGDDVARALAALAVLPASLLHDAGPRLDGIAPPSPEALADFATVVAAGDSAAAIQFVRGWVDDVRRDPKGEPAAAESIDARTLSLTFESESRALLAALRFTDERADADWWLDALRESEGRLERLLLATLAMTCDPRHVPIWERLLADKDSRFRALGARGLRFVADPETSGRLLDALEGETDADARTAIVAALADLRLDRRFDASIASALEREFASAADERIPRFAARGIGLRHDVATRESIENALVHRDPFVRFNVADALFSEWTRPAPSDLLSHCLEDADTTISSLALHAAAKSGTPDALPTLEAIVRDTHRSQLERELALDAFVRSGASAKSVASLSSAILAERATSPLAPSLAAILSALSGFPAGAVRGAADLVSAARESLVVPSEAIDAARSLRVLGAAEVPPALIAARDRAAGEDRLNLSAALIALGDPSGADDVVYRLRQRHAAALRALSMLRGLRLPDSVVAALANLSESKDPEFGYRSNRLLADFDPERATSIARERVAIGASSSERLDGALVLAKLGRPDAAPALAEALLFSDESLALTARRLFLSVTEARERITAFSSAKAGGTDAADSDADAVAIIERIVAWRDESAALARALAAEEHEALDQRVRQIESLMRAVDATRTRFLDDLAAVATSRHSSRRQWAFRAFAVLSDREAAELLAAIRGKGDTATRKIITDAASHSSASPPTRHDTVRAALIDWISRAQSPQ